MGIERGVFNPKFKNIQKKRGFDMVIKRTG
jgi:hypothetical protein